MVLLHAQISWKLPHHKINYAYSTPHSFLMIYTLQSIRTAKNEFNYVQIIYNILLHSCVVFSLTFGLEKYLHTCAISHHIALSSGKI